MKRDVETASSHPPKIYPPFAAFAAPSNKLNETDSFFSELRKTKSFLKNKLKASSLFRKIS